MSRNLLSMFLFRSSIVSCLTFKSLIRLELIFVYGVRKWSSFILCMWFSSFPTPFIKETVVAPLYCLCSLVEDQLAVVKGVSLWALCSVPLIYLFILVQIHTVLITVALEYSREAAVLHLCSSPLLCVDHSESFASPHKLHNQFVDIHKTCWDVHWDCIESISQVGKN